MHKVSTSYDHPQSNDQVEQADERLNKSYKKWLTQIAEIGSHDWLTFFGHIELLIRHLFTCLHIV